MGGRQPLEICDIGCGKGRYLKRLVQDCLDNRYYASDVSFKVMEKITCVTEKKIGRLTNVAYETGQFDFVYVCEAFEHAMNIHGAFNELYRIVKPDGKLVIIDKPLEKLGQLELYEWEQWIDDKDIRRFTEECGGKLDIEESIPYENKADGLFRAWIITKR